jgi:hypothetical protein
LLDENAVCYRDVEDFFLLGRSRVERMLKEFGRSGEPPFCQVLELTCAEELKPLWKLKIFCL